MQDFTSFFTTFSCFNVADWVSHVLVIFQISLAPAKKQPTLRLTGRCHLMAAYSLVSPQLLKCLFLRIDKNEWRTQDLVYVLFDTNLVNLDES